MSGREAFKIKGVVRVHNAILCVWSGLMLAGVIWQIFGVSAPQTGFYNDKGVMCDPGSKLYSKGSLLSYVTYSYYQSKFYELLDTVIIVLKKRPLTFLQTFHHVSVMYLVWSWMDSGYTQSWVGVALNTCVHVFMYYYFSVATFGHRPWWRRHLTSGQLLQFTTVFFNIWWWLFFTGGDTLDKLNWHKNTNRCGGAAWSPVFSQMVNIAFLFLFGWFYVENYMGKKSKPKAA